MKIKRPQQNNQLFLFLLLGLLLLIPQNTLAQDSLHISTESYTWTPLEATTITTSYFKHVNFSDTWEHQPSKEDKDNYHKYKKLIEQYPNKKTYRKYFSLACSLWELNKITEAEKMFLNIITSTSTFYTSDYWNGSDIPGDTSRNIYSYGSYSYNYKHHACIYLCKLYIERSDFEKAYHYLVLADKKHPLNYTCGTGYAWYKESMIGLYGLCFNGLRKYNELIPLYLPYYDYTNIDPLLNAIRQLYSQDAILDSLSKAETSIVFYQDTSYSISITISTNAEGKETREEQKYLSRTATMCLFGHELILSQPLLENNETVSRELYINEFKKTWLYTELTKKME